MALAALTCDNESAAPRWWNTERPLTRSSDLTREGLAMQATRPTCSISTCEKPVIARGWCTAHWTRWKRHGDPTGGGRPREPMLDECTIEGCDVAPRARGLCVTHYRQDMAESDPEWRAAFLAKRREWHAANPERVAEVRARSRERNLQAALDRAAQWRAENRDRVLLHNWLRRRREYGLPANVVETVHPDVVFDRDQGVCQLCLTEVDPGLPWPDPASATIDHTIPAMEAEAEHSYANVVLAHWDCNRRKSWVVPRELRALTEAGGS